MARTRSRPAVIAEHTLTPVRTHCAASGQGMWIAYHTFRTVTASYWPGLFHCYDDADLPRTNNELEQYFGSARYHERRATGRKQASPGLVVRGSARIVASVASRLHSFSGEELCPTDLTRWRALRSELEHRHGARCMQYRFRRSPESYLAALEDKLIKERLPP